MLSPQYEPVFGAPARTMSGALAEMERLIGDALYSGYVGYNGRAPGASGRAGSGSASAAEPAERGKAGGDARHILVAYFEIKELTSILGVDWETSALAIRVFRYTASNTSLRNRSVELLAAASFIAAVSRRVREADDERAAAGIPKGVDEPAWLAKLRSLNVRAIADAASINEHELQRNLKVVNLALRKQRPDSNESVVANMPAFCAELGLGEVTRRVAIEIAQKAMQLNICSRRAPLSVAAACIHLACQLNMVRKTQAEVCRATTVTEVTLRKVHKELIEKENVLVPEWFRKLEKNEDLAPRIAPRRAAPRLVAPYPPHMQQSVARSILPNPYIPPRFVDNMRSRQQPPLPPPLPPGYGPGQGGQQPVLGPSAANGSAHPVRAPPARPAIPPIPSGPSASQPKPIAVGGVATSAGANAMNPSLPVAMNAAGASAPVALNGQTNAAGTQGTLPPTGSGAQAASGVPAPGATAASNAVPVAAGAPAAPASNVPPTANAPPAANVAATVANMDTSQQTSMMMAMMQNPVVLEAFAKAMAQAANAGVPATGMPAGMPAGMPPGMMPPPPPPPPLPPQIPAPTATAPPPSAANRAPPAAAPPSAPLPASAAVVKQENEHPVAPVVAQVSAAGGKKGTG